MSDLIANLTANTYRKQAQRETVLSGTIYIWNKIEIKNEELFQVLFRTVRVHINNIVWNNLFVGQSEGEFVDKHMSDRIAVAVNHAERQLIVKFHGSRNV